MKETRGEKLGRNLAVWVLYTIKTVLESQRRGYRARFFKEFKRYSFEPRRKGEPRNSGCVRELEDIDEIDPSHPQELAKVVKEILHLEYQKQTSYKTYQGFENRFLREIES